MEKEKHKNRKDQEAQKTVTIPNERYKPVIKRVEAEKDEYPVSRFKIPLPKTKPNADYNFCCIYFDGTKWEKSKKTKSQSKVYKRSETHFKKRSEVNVKLLKNEKKLKKSNKDDRKARDKSPTRKLSESKFKYRRRSKYFLSGPDYLRLCRKPCLVNKEIQTDNTPINDLSSEEASSTKSEILKKLEIHRKTLEAKYSEEKIKKLIEKLKNNPHINESIIRMFQQKTVKERRCNLSKQTFPLIEITSTEVPLEYRELIEEKEKTTNKKLQQDNIRIKMPHRKISDRELVEMYETKNNSDQETKESPKNLKPPRPQIPRRIITEEEKEKGLKLQIEQQKQEEKKPRPTIPRRKLTEPPPKENLILVNEPLPIVNFCSPKNNEQKLLKSVDVSSTTSNEENMDLSDLFLKLVKTRLTTDTLKIDETKRANLAIEVREETKTEMQPLKTDKGINVPSYSNVKVETKTAKKLFAKEERKIKTLWTVRNSRWRRPTADALKNRSLKILSKDKIKNQNEVTTKRSFTVSTNKEEKIIIDCTNPAIRNEMLAESKTLIKAQEFHSKVHHFFKHRSNIPKMTCTTFASTITPEVQPVIRTIINESTNDNQLMMQNSQSVDSFRASTCPSIATEKRERPGRSLLPKLSKSANFSKCDKSINNINAPSSGGGKSCPPESTISGKTEKKWAAGSIYNSTLLFTKVNKDSSKDSSFKKRKEYYRMLRTKQKPSVNTKCSKYNKVLINQKCPLSKNIYYSKIENFPPKLKNFYTNLNSELNFLNDNQDDQDYIGDTKIDENDNEDDNENEIENENEMDNEKIDMLVSAHNFKSDSDICNIDCDEHSYCSIESGIQSFTTSNETKQTLGFDLEKSTKSDSKYECINICKKKSKFRVSTSKAYTVASCIIPSSPSMFLANIINLNNDIESDDSGFNKYYSDSDQSSFIKSSVDNSARSSDESGIELDTPKKRKCNFWAKLMKLLRNKMRYTNKFVIKEN